MELEVPQMALLAGAALLAGMVNAVAGGGSLISFPALLAVGYPAVTANITNTVALTPGYVGGTLGYRRELAGQRRRALVLGSTSVVGALAGAMLLVVSSPVLFEQIVPFLVFLACGLLAAQTRLAQVLQRRLGAGGRMDARPGSPRALPQHLVPLVTAQFLAAAYGAYFGAGLGIMTLAILGIFIADGLQRLNALKGLLSLVINLVGALYFVIFADVVWLAVFLMALASLLGGQLGVLAARRLNERVLRRLVIVFGVVVGLRLLLR